MNRLSCAVSLLLIGCPEPPDQVGLPSPATVAPVPSTVVPTPVPTPTPGPTAPLHVVVYNVESGDAEAPSIADLVERVDGEHIWGFSEVQNASWLDAFTTAAADHGSSQVFANLLGTTGGNDRLGVVWDTSVVTYRSHDELSGFGGSYRAPLAVTFEMIETGVEFVFVVNHLAQGDVSLRHDQADLLNTWAARQTLPTIVGGDFNFPWDVDTGDQSPPIGFDNMVAGGEMVWVRPDPLIKTQCSFRFNSVLDFIFAGGPAREWEAEGEILFPQNVFCNDTPLIPDHRPVEAVFQVPLPPE